MMIISGPCCLATTLGGKSKWSMCCQFERGSPAGEICKSSSGILCVSRVADTVNTVEEDAVSVHVQHNIAPAASRSNRILNVHSCIISSDRILAVAGIVPHQLNDMYFIMLYFILFYYLFFFVFFDVRQRMGISIPFGPEKPTTKTRSNAELMLILMGIKRYEAAGQKHQPVLRVA